MDKLPETIECDVHGKKDMTTGGACPICLNIDLRHVESMVATVAAGFAAHGPSADDLLGVANKAEIVVTEIIKRRLERYRELEKGVWLDHGRATAPRESQQVEHGGRDCEAIIAHLRQKIKAGTSEGPPLSQEVSCGFCIAWMGEPVKHADDCPWLALVNEAAK